MRRLRLGVAGLGRAFLLMAPALRAHPRLVLAACCDPRPEARARFLEDVPGSRAHADFAALCADPEIDAVYLATPHRHHAAQAIGAARAGRHVMVEKPMALTLAEAAAMRAAAQAAGTVLMIGHSHGQDAPVRLARRLIAEGRTGAPRLIAALNFTDFLWRPRRPEELDTARGGGVVLGQAAHQLDVIRVLAGGMMRSIRAATSPGRGTEGGYAAFLDFPGGAATATYSGFGRFDSDQLAGWIGEMGAPKPPTTPGAARARLDPAREAEARAGRGYGPLGLPAAGAPAFHQHFGQVIVQCEAADLRLTPEGVEVHDDSGLHLLRPPLPAAPRAEVLDEFCAAVLDGIPPRHDGAWGMATLECCLALLAAARSGETVALHHQCPFRDR